jgi:hypothetical protein
MMIYRVQQSRGCKGPNYRSDSESESNSANNDAHHPSVDPFLALARPQSVE